MKYIFISDLHLSSDTIASNILFYNLLNQWRGQIDSLYILGDFFDYWLGDDENTKFNLEMKDKFKNFTKYTPVYFIVGNHDFTLGKKFCRDTGIKIISDCSVLVTQKHRILLSHGDDFCSLDIDYHKMKKVLRNKFLLYLLLKLPLAWRYKLKQKIEHKSLSKTNTKPSETYVVVNSTIIEFCNKYNTDIVIHGHTHNPGIYNITDGKQIIKRIEIPDWADRKPGGYVSFEEDNFTLYY